MHSVDPCDIYTRRVAFAQSDVERTEQWKYCSVQYRYCYGASKMNETPLRKGERI